MKMLGHLLFWMLLGFLLGISLRIFYLGETPGQVWDTITSVITG